MQYEEKPAGNDDEDAEVDDEKRDENAEIDENDDEGKPKGLFG